MASTREQRRGNWRHSLRVATVGTAVVAAILLVLVLGDRPLSRAAVNYDQLLSSAEATLYYPGAQILEQQASAEGRVNCQVMMAVCAEDDQPAQVATSLVTDASEASIYRWYAWQLAIRGWRLTAKDATGLRRYGRRQGEQFWISIRYDDRLHTSLPYSGQGTLYTMVYEAGGCQGTKVGCDSRDSYPLVLPWESILDRLPKLGHPVTYEILRSRFTSHLYYPDSLLMQTWAVGEGRNPELGYDPAALMSSVLLAENASPKQIRDWYGSNLSAQGWLPAADSGDGTDEYVRGNDERFRLAAGQEGGILPYGERGTFYSIQYLASSH